MRSTNFVVLGKLNPAFRYIFYGLVPRPQKDAAAIGARLEDFVFFRCISLSFGRRRPERLLELAKQIS